ncbi:MAG TPA: nitrate reductase molybdenum cofactor assembly chaperone [Nocardioidaceae bacterium]|nr:nitrate reductase molybdenum cofactor assembly chaperone [Nocardioidaceae bacterium]
MRVRRESTVPADQGLVCKLASLLLQYPDERLFAVLDDVDAALAELAPRRREPLESVVSWLREQGPSAAAEHHVDTFDMTRRCSPYLTYFRYGDTRQRGMALLAFKHTYRQSGWEPTDDDLPDYLPAVLEFAALAPDGAGHRLLAAHRAGLELLRLALHEEKSPYARVLDEVCAGLPALSDRQSSDVRRLAADGPPKEDVGLDPIGSEPFAPPEMLGAEAMR